MNQESVSPEAVHTRRLAFSAIALLLISTGAIGATFYLRSQLHRRPTTQKEANIARVKALQAAIEPSSAEVAKRHAHYRSLRTKWRPWALKNKALLTRMLNDKNGDQRLLLAVREATPALPTVQTAGFDVAELNGGNPKLPLFTWEPLTKSDKDPKDIQRTNARLARRYALLHDYVLSASHNKGRSVTYFWVSGRITESKEIDNPNAESPGQPATIKAPLEEIEPPYDFLLN